VDATFQRLLTNSAQRRISFTLGPDGESAVSRAWLQVPIAHEVTAMSPYPIERGTRLCNGPVKQGWIQVEVLVFTATSASARTLPGGRGTFIDLHGLPPQERGVVRLSHLPLSEQKEDQPTSQMQTTDYLLAGGQNGETTDSLPPMPHMPSLQRAFAANSAAARRSHVRLPSTYGLSIERECRCK
jgi:hypothetical protein